MTLFQIVLIVVVAFMSLTIAILCIMVRNLDRSKARAFQYIAQVKRDLVTLIQTNTYNLNKNTYNLNKNTYNLNKQVRCSEELTKRLNNLEDAMRHNRRPSKSKNNAPSKN